MSDTVGPDVPSGSQRPVEPREDVAPASAPMRELITGLWGNPDPDGPVHVSLGPLPASYREVERYAVVPSPANARFLVPLAGRAAAAASLIRYNRLRSGKVRATRALLGAGFRLGLAPHLLRHRMIVGVRADVSAGELADHLLGEHLRQALGIPDIVFGLGVRPIDPNSKPTLQIFAPDGRPMGYAKIGWSPATRGMTATEARAAQAIRASLEKDAGRGSAAGGSRRLCVPAVLHHGPWRNLLVTVTAPLPPGVTGHPDPDSPPDPVLLLAIAESSGIRSESLTETAFFRRLRDEAAAIDDEPRLAERLANTLDGLAKTHADTEIRIGRWHGDWVPWNICHHGDALHVFDWEHSSPDAPVGLDLLHWRFQVALVLRGEPLEKAVAAVEVAADRELGPFGVPAAERRLLARLYLLEMFTRTYRLKRGGGGWNRALFPAMLDVLEHWNIA